MFIAHRINTWQEQINIPLNIGIEFDVRDSGNKIIVTHDPFTIGQEFEDFISHLHKMFLIINIKSEGIEINILEILKKYSFEEFFFLDCSFPAIIKLSRIGEKRIALRFSEFESIENISLMANKIQWVWVDCFTQFPLTKNIADMIHSLGLKICIVSPELHSRPIDIIQYSKYIKDNSIAIDAVCSKIYNLNKWDNIY
jgi:hypothetical protein